jgi:hypothetical protein
VLVPGLVEGDGAVCAGADHRGGGRGTLLALVLSVPAAGCFLVVLLVWLRVLGVGGGRVLLSAYAGNCDVWNKLLYLDLQPF